MNPEQPASVYDAPEPPMHLKPKVGAEFHDHGDPTAEHAATDIHPDDKGVQLVADDEDAETAIPMEDEEAAEPIEMPDAA